MNIFMAAAIKLAQVKMLEGHGGPFGTVIVKNNQIIAQGFNRVTSTNDPTAHAEIVAIREACRKLNTFELDGCHLYASCEPCPMCLAAIYWARIDTIYYAATKEDAANAGFDDKVIYYELTKKNEEKNITMVQLMRSQSLDVFSAWQNFEDKVLY